MYDLTLRPGPSLVFGFPETRQNKTTRATANVTAHASRFLFHAVSIEPGVVLNDILLLLDICPALVDTFRLRFAEQVRDEVLKGPLAQASDGGQTCQALDHLELRWAWGLDTDTLEYSSVHALELSGVGPVVQADDARQGLRAGDRERWSLKLTPVRELLHLSVIVRHDFAITETDHDSRKYGEPVANGRLTEVTLGQLIYGLLSELTFHGGPTEQAALSEELVQQLSRLESGDEDTVDAESVFNELRPEDAGFSAMFETLGDVTQSDVRRVMHDIEDDQTVGLDFDAAFGGRVRVREQHRRLTGRQFRKAFRGRCEMSVSRVGEHDGEAMSTKFMLRSQGRCGDEPGFELYHDLFEEIACEGSGSEPPGFLCLEGVEGELQTIRQGGATVAVKLPRSTAGALGLVPEPSAQ